ncbi:MAG: cyanophycin synthetase [Geminicoccaceae bacterium]
MDQDEQETPVVRLNARDTDAFDLGNLTFFPGPNTSLPRAALVFDLALTGGPLPLPMAAYVEAVARIYPHLAGACFPDHAHLFAALVSLVSRLDLGLHLNRFSVHPRGRLSRVATQALDRRTQHRAVYFVWDWLEAIGTGTPFDHAAGMAGLQALFNRSPYGGPTTYALLRTADARGIPTAYLHDEGLIQYGYGRRHVRGVSTTFSTDSQLDSNFTTRKDDCKAFLGRLGFPVPKGGVVTKLAGALAAAEEIGYPVAVKPLDGHKGIGVTANVCDEEELRAAFARAGGGSGAGIIVETSLAGSDFRLLCVNGRFVAGLERRPPWVEGDGVSTVDQLIERENATPARADSPVSPMAKIIRDEAMIAAIEQQGYTRQSIPAAGATILLRKVANLSAGGVSIDVTPGVHVDNIVLAQEVARHFRLTCLGLDVVAMDLARSWKEGGFGIIEINAAPGVYMHVKPAKGEGIDVPGAILDTWFGQGRPARIPIFAFNTLGPESIKEIVDLVLSRFPHWNVGAVCPEGVFINRSERPMHPNYLANVDNLLRDPGIDLLLVAYDGDTLEHDGMAHEGHDIVVLDKPTPTEENLARDLRPGGTLIKLTGRDVMVRRQRLVEEFTLDPLERFGRVFLREVALIIGNVE